MSNASLHYTSLSFYTMVKSSSPVWVLIFAILFQLERPSLKLIGVVLIISFGTCLTITGDISYSVPGLELIMGASIASGLRWSLTQILLQDNTGGMDNPISTMTFISPVAAVFAGMLSILFEIFGDEGLLNSSFSDSPHAILKTLLIALIGAILAYFMVLSEYYLIKNTSVMTISIIVSLHLCRASLKKLSLLFWPL